MENENMELSVARILILANYVKLRFCYNLYEIPKLCCQIGRSGFEMTDFECIIFIFSEHSLCNYLYDLYRYFLILGLKKNSCSNVGVN